MDATLKNAVIALGIVSPLEPVGSESVYYKIKNKKHLKRSESESSQNTTTLESTPLGFWVG